MQHRNAPSASDPASPSEEAPSPNESGARVRLDAGEASVGRTQRNGHASVLAKVLQLIAVATPPSYGRPRTAMISTEDEAILRDADERQISASGVAIARSGTSEAWRTFLREHFRRRYDLAVTFDAPVTSVR